MTVEYGVQAQAFGAFVSAVQGICTIMLYDFCNGWAKKVELVCWMDLEVGFVTQEIRQREKARILDLTTTCFGAGFFSSRVVSDSVVVVRLCLLSCQDCAFLAFGSRFLPRHLGPCGSQLSHYLINIFLPSHLTTSLLHTSSSANIACQLHWFSES